MWPVCLTGYAQYVTVCVCVNMCIQVKEELLVEALTKRKAVTVNDKLILPYSHSEVDTVIIITVIYCRLIGGLMSVCVYLSLSLFLSLFLYAQFLYSIYCCCLFDSLYILLCH